MTNDGPRAGSVPFAGSVEASRIGFPLQRGGAAATLEWVRRTLTIYRRAVLKRRQFASDPQYRARFVASCLDFRRWLAANGAYGIRRAAASRSAS